MYEACNLKLGVIYKLKSLKRRARPSNLSNQSSVKYRSCEKLELELELSFYLNTVNLSDKITIVKMTIYFTLSLVS